MNAVNVNIRTDKERKNDVSESYAKTDEASDATAAAIAEENRIVHSELPVSSVNTNEKKACRPSWIQHISLRTFPSVLPA